MPSVGGQVVSNRALKGEITLLMENDEDPEFSVNPRSSADGKCQCEFSWSGRYRLYAFEDFHRDAWGNPSLMTLLAAKSVVLEIKEGEHLHVSLPLISAKEFQEALRKTGF